jgi:hypothetical protein
MNRSLACAAFVIAGTLLGAAAIKARADYMLWADNADAAFGGSAAVGDIQRANLDGSGQAPLVAGLAGPDGIAVDRAAGIMMYWSDGEADNNTGDIRRAKLDGTGAQTIVSNQFFPTAIALDAAGGSIHWRAHDQQVVLPYGLNVFRANLDGSSVHPVYHNPVPYGNGMLALDLAGGKIYFTDYNDGLIERCNLDGTGVTTLSSGLNSPLGIALDIAGGKMYWIDASNIYKSNLDGSGRQTLVSGLKQPEAAALDLSAGKMYWTDYGDPGTANGDIRSANLDGTGAQVLISSLNNPWGIALVPEPVALPLLGGAVVASSLLLARRPRNRTPLSARHPRATI